jgi:hypothetical protein
VQVIESIHDVLGDSPEVQAIARRIDNIKLPKKDDATTIEMVIE